MLNDVREETNKAALCRKEAETHLRNNGSFLAMDKIQDAKQLNSSFLKIWHLYEYGKEIVINMARK